MSEQGNIFQEGLPGQPCPYCGSDRVEETTTVDLAFGEEIPCKECKNCGQMIFDESD